MYSGGGMVEASCLYTTIPLTTTYFHVYTTFYLFKTRTSKDEPPSKDER